MSRFYNNIRRWLLGEEPNRIRDQQEIDDLYDRLHYLAQRDLVLKGLIKKIKERPDHGFDRNGSHSAGRYVCYCGYENCYEADDHWQAKLDEMIKEIESNDQR